MNRAVLFSLTLAAALPAVATPVRHHAATAKAPAPVTLPGGTVVVDHKAGTGPAAVAGQTVTVDYTGWLDAGGGRHGKQFDSSVGKTPFIFPLGGGQVIPGWDMGVAGMKLGGKRTLIIPAGQGYGERGAGDDIPPGATLVFDIVLLKIE